MISRQEPFPDRVDTSSFYDGGSRRDIVEQITSALSEDVALITLTGTDGSGKTIICRVVREELSGDRDVVFFEQGVESFDEVVNRLGAQVGLDETEEISDRKARLEKTIELLSDSDRRLIIIIDSAENVFLATLERIRRMLDEVNADRFCVQLIFSGRPLLALNYKQLAIIAFEPVEEEHLSLDPLDGEQTFNYLNHCLERAGFPEKERFTRTQAENIADVARGNFRLINQLGGRYFDSEREVDLDEAEIEELYSGVSVAREDGAYEKISAGLKNVDLDFLKVPRLGTRWYVAGGCLIVIILLVFLLFSGGEEETEELPGSADVPELTLERVEPDPIEIPEPSPAPSPVAETTPEQTSEDPVKDAPPPVENEKQVDTAVAGPEPEKRKTVVQEPAPLVLEEQRDELVEQEPDLPVVVETEKIDPEQPFVVETEEVKIKPAGAADTETVETEPLMIESEVEAAVESTESVVAVSDNQAAEIEDTPAGAARSSDAPVAAPSVEENTASTVVPSESVEEADETAAAERGAETLQVPQLTVLPRKLPSTESVPFEVVTLDQESKIKPEETAPPTAAQADPEEPGSAPDPEVSQQPRERAGQEITETVQPEAQPVPQPAPAAPARVAESKTTPRPVQKSTAPARNSGTYYAERLAAGSRWLVGGSSQKYTVQLMVLNAEDAQDNVREMLVEEGYQSIMDKLYILKKSGQPQTVMLYYGEFDSSAEARQAKAQLPSFLSKLEPYELAVKEAVAKARADQ